LQLGQCGQKWQLQVVPQHGPGLVQEELRGVSSLHVRRQSGIAISPSMHTARARQRLHLRLPGKRDLLRYLAGLPRRSGIAISPSKHAAKKRPRPHLRLRGRRDLLRYLAGLRHRSRQLLDVSLRRLSCRAKEAARSAAELSQGELS